jgi:hypothetical protein
MRRQIFGNTLQHKEIFILSDNYRLSLPTATSPPEKAIDAVNTPKESGKGCRSP